MTSKSYAEKLHNICKSIKMTQDTEEKRCWHNEAGELCIQMHQYDQALEHFKEQLFLTKKERKNEVLVAQRFIGEAYTYLKKYQKAKEIFKECIELGEQLGCTREHERVCRSLGNMIIEMYKIDENCGDETWKEGMSYLKKSLELCKKSILVQNSIENKELELESRYNIANAYACREESQYLSKAIESYLFIQQECQNNNSILYGKCEHSLGNVELQKKNYQKAIQHFCKDIKACKQNKEYVGMLTSMKNMGLAYYGMKKYDDAIKTFSEILDLGEQYQLEELADELAETSIADYVQEKEEYGKYKKEIAKLNEPTNDNVNEYIKLRSYSIDKFEDYDVAIRLCSELEKFYIQYPNNDMYRNLIDKAIAYKSMHQRDKALKTLNSIVSAIGNNNNYLDILATAYIEIGNTLEETDFQTILQNYEHALDVAAKINDKRLIDIANKNISYILDKSKPNTNALLPNLAIEDMPNRNNKSISHSSGNAENEKKLIKESHKLPEILPVVESYSPPKSVKSKNNYSINNDAQSPSIKIKLDDSVYLIPIYSNRITIREAIKLANKFLGAQGVLNKVIPSKPNTNEFIVYHRLIKAEIKGLKLESDANINYDASLNLFNIAECVFNCEINHEQLPSVSLAYQEISKQYKKPVSSQGIYNESLNISGLFLGDEDIKPHAWAILQSNVEKVDISKNFLTEKCIHQILNNDFVIQQFSLSADIKGYCPFANVKQLCISNNPLITEDGSSFYELVRWIKEKAKILECFDCSYINIGECECCDKIVSAILDIMSLQVLNLNFCDIVFLPIFSHEKLKKLCIVGNGISSSVVEGIRSINKQLEIIV